MEKSQAIVRLDQGAAKRSLWVKIYWYYALGIVVEVRLQMVIWALFLRLEQRYIALVLRPMEWIHWRYGQWLKMGLISRAILPIMSMSIAALNLTISLLFVIMQRSAVRIFHPKHFDFTKIFQIQLKQKVQMMRLAPIFLKSVIWLNGIVKNLFLPTYEALCRRINRYVFS